MAFIDVTCHAVFVGYRIKSIEAVNFLMSESYSEFECVIDQQVNLVH